MKNKKSKKDKEEVCQENYSAKKTEFDAYDVRFSKLSDCDTRIDNGRSISSWRFLIK